MGIDEIARSTVEEYLAQAPPPDTRCDRRNNRRYPLRFWDIENQFGPGLKYEYPTMIYPYNQNARGHAYETLPSGRRRRVDPGYVRTITDRYQNIRGLCYHPTWSMTEHVRAREFNIRIRLSISTWRCDIPRLPTLAEIWVCACSVLSRLSVPGPILPPLVYKSVVVFDTRRKRCWVMFGVGHVINRRIYWLTFRVDLVRRGQRVYLESFKCGMALGLFDEEPV